MADLNKYNCDPSREKIFVSFFFVVFLSPCSSENKYFFLYAGSTDSRAFTNIKTKDKLLFKVLYLIYLGSILALSWIFHLAFVKSLNFPVEIPHLSN